MKRNSFVFYRSFFEAIEKLKKNDKLTIYSHLCKYALGEDTEELTGVPAAIFELIKPQIDANFRKYENGLKGGRKRNQTETKTKPNGNQNITKPEPNVNVNVNDNVNENDNDNVNVNVNGLGSEVGEAETADEAESEKEFPSLSEIKTEIDRKGYAVDAERFHSYYSSKNWKTANGSPIHDWRAMLRVWNLKEKREPKKNRFNNFDQRTYTDDDLERELLCLE